MIQMKIASHRKPPDRRNLIMSNVVLFPKPYIARNPKPGDRVWHHAAGWGSS